MISTLTVTIPATSLALLTVAERRVAAGLAATDSSQDAALLALDLRVAAAICDECNIAVGTGAEPTLLQETLTEVFWEFEADRLFLSRRHNVAITSIVYDDTTLTTTDYLVDSEGGILTRIYSAAPASWSGRKSTIVYQAGFATVPAALKQAAIDGFKSFITADTRDQFVKATSVETVDVETVRTEYWAGSLPGQTDIGKLPLSVVNGLRRFRNMTI